MLGGWERLSFKANDMLIDRARTFCEKQVAEKFNDEYNCSAMEVYSQLVNGKNYKVLLLGKHFKKEEFKCFTGVTYVPLGERPHPKFQEDSFKAVDGTPCTLAGDKREKIKNALKAHYKEDKDFEPVKFFENALDGANVYVLKVGTVFVGVYECGNEVTVDCVVR